MSDLISRQAAIDALKHNQDVYSHNFHDDPIDKYTTAIIATDIETIVNLPSAQPDADLIHLQKEQAYMQGWEDRRASIIRCKDCKYCTEDYYTDGNVPYRTCSEWDSGTDVDGFCYMAERRTDESD